jgi:hypothetical protein
VSAYTAVAQRARATIARKGGPVTLTTTTGRVYNEDTGVWTGGTPLVASSVAVQEEDDPERFRVLGLTLNDPVTLLVAAAGLTLTPAPNMALGWGGAIYTVKNCESLKPDGQTAITHTVIGDR